LNIPKVLSYKIPAEMKVSGGCRVRVPVKTCTYVGVIVALRCHDDSGLKPISEVIDESALVPTEIIELLMWCARYYHASLGACVALAFPPYFRIGNTLDLEPECLAYKTDMKHERLGSRQKALLDAIPEDGIAPDVLRKIFPGSSASISRLVQRGLIELRQYTPNPRIMHRVDHSPEQKDAVGIIIQAMNSGEFSSIVLHGITGSGKTEVYLTCALKALEAGRSVLYMVPEIALTPQTIERIRSRIPNEMALFHSGLSPRARALEFLKVARGNARFVLGTRSAIFAPLRDIGLIVVDEEHDGSFKQSDGVPYNARDLSILRAQRQKAVVILGSATPSMDTFVKVGNNAAGLVVLKSRFGEAALPDVEIVDMRSRSEIISGELLSAIKETLERGAQTLLFINRRGFSSAMVCPACGKVLKCSRCDRSLTYHKAKTAALCHYCGYTQKLPEICPGCGCLDMRPIGLGTERIMEEVLAHFPGIRILRMDSDEVNTPGKLDKALSAIRCRDIDVIVGTQMIAKGHDFPHLTLVGVMYAEQLLYMPDFRAIERTFQQVVQVAGRAGRQQPDTRVFVQTLVPDHPVIAAIANHDYHAMIEAEREIRHMSGFPPFAHMALCTFSSYDPRALEQTIRRIAAGIKSNSVKVMGPVPAPIAFLRGSHRRQITLLSENRRALHRVVDEIEKVKIPAGIKRKIDIDPYDML